MNTGDIETARPADATASGARTDRLPRVMYAIAMSASTKFGSLEEQMFAMAQEFRARGGLFLPVFLCDEALPLAPEYEAAGIEAHCLDIRRFSVSGLMRLISMIRKYRIDVVHWSFTSTLANPYVWLLSILAPSTRHFFTDHASRYLPIPPPRTGIRQALKRVLLRRYGKMLCISDFVLKCLENDGCWSNLERCVHFVNVERFAPDPVARDQVRSRLNAQEQFVTVTVAQLTREKGIDVALRALANLRRDVTLWIIGEGPCADDFRQEARELGVEDRVRFLGLQRHVEPYLQAADCFVCPSVWGEGAGLVNLEAQACGLPTVASDIGGIPELVIDGTTGFLFPPGDARALAERIDRIAGDPELHRRLGANARTRMIEHHSTESVITSYVDIYARA